MKARRILLERPAIHRNSASGYFVQSAGPRSTIPAGLAPPGSRLDGAVECLAGVRSANKCDAVKVHGLPVVSVYLELKSLLVAGRVDQDRTPVFGKLSHSVPQEISDACRDLSDEYPRADLQEPARQVAPKPGRTGGDDEHYHGTSTDGSAHDCPLATVPSDPSQRCTTSAYS